MTSLRFGKLKGHCHLPLHKRLGATSHTSQPSRRHRTRRGRRLRRHVSCGHPISMQYPSQLPRLSGLTVTPAPTELLPAHRALPSLQRSSPSPSSPSPAPLSPVPWQQTRHMSTQQIGIASGAVRARGPRAQLARPCGRSPPPHRWVVSGGDMAHGNG